MLDKPIETDEDYQELHRISEKDKKTMKNTFAFPVIAVIGLFLVLGCGDLANINTSAPPSNTTAVKTDPTKEASTEKTEEKTGGVTKANFEKIKTGMKYEEVVKILGKEGELISENELAGYKTSMYQWEGDEGDFGANMNAMFQNGKLVSKSQFGLK